MTSFDSAVLFAVVATVASNVLFVGVCGLSVWHEKTARRFSERDVATWNTIGSAWSSLGYLALLVPLGCALLVSLPAVALCCGIALVPFAMARLARGAADYLRQDASILAADREFAAVAQGIARSGDAGRGARIRGRSLLATRTLLVLALLWVVSCWVVAPLVSLGIK